MMKMYSWVYIIIGSFISWTITLLFIIQIQQRAKSRVQESLCVQLWIRWDQLLIWAKFWWSKYENEKNHIHEFHRPLTRVVHAQKFGMNFLWIIFLIMGLLHVTHEGPWVEKFMPIHYNKFVYQEQIISSFINHISNH